MKLSTVLATAVAATGALAAPASTTTPPPFNPDLKHAHRTYRRWVNRQEDQMVLDPQDQLLVNKDGTLDDVTTAIVSFVVDEGKTCRFLFNLWDDRDVSTGTQTVDIYTVSNLPPDDENLTVPSRQQHVARGFLPLGKFPDPETAVWTDTYHGWPEFPCPVGEPSGFEFVGVGDNVEIRWDIGANGPRIEVVE